MTYNYSIPVATVLDVDVSIWSLVKYIFKWMLAFIIVNVVLTLPAAVAWFALFSYLVKAFQHNR